ncbi:DUF4340 domain-containing protein [Chloroflexota bacterium]
MKSRSILILATILAVLAISFFYFNRPEPPPPTKPQLYVWLIEMDDIKHIEIHLPKDGLSQSFIKISEEDKFPWYFDDPQRTPIDQVRWGGGIPLLLSGPGLDRVIIENTSAEQLAKFGLTQPRMKVVLTMENGQILNINVGDSTPDNNNFYVQVPDTNSVATVDISWHRVIERLAKEPPYVAAAEQ